MLIAPDGKAVTPPPSAGPTVQTCIVDLAPLAAGGASTEASRRMSPAGRDALVSHLFELRRLESEGQLDVGARDKAAVMLSGFANGPATDPLTRRLARNTLEEWTAGTASLENSCLLHGPTEGAPHWLRKIERDLAGADLPTGIPGTRIPEALERLERDLPDRSPVPESALRAVAHLTRRLDERVHAPRTATAQVYEPTSRLEEDALACGTLLADWWTKGQLEVVRHGRKLAPGEVDVAHLARLERLPVRGHTIEIAEASSPPSAEVLEETRRIFSHIDTFNMNWKSQSPSGIQELESLAQDHPEQAGAILAAAVHDPELRRDPEHLQRLAVLCQEGATRPILRTALEGQLESLLHFVSDDAARGDVARTAQEGRGRCSLVFSLLTLCPERIDGTYLEREVRPLVLCEEQTDAVYTARQVVRYFDLMADRKPELAEPLVRLLLDNPDRLREADCEFLSTVHRKQGWLPTSEADLQEVAAMLLPPPGARSLLDYAKNGTYTDFGSALEILTDLKAKEPERLADLRLPDPAGQMRPLGDALLEHLLATSVTAEEYKYSASRLSELSHFIFPQDELEGRLLDVAESALSRTPTLARMAPREQAAFVVLNGLELEGTHRTRYQALVETARHEKQEGHVFLELLDEANSVEVKQAWDSIKTEPMPPGRLLETAERGLWLAHCVSGSSSAGCASAMLEDLEKAWDAIPAEGQVEKQVAASALLARSEASLASHGLLARMPLPDLAGLQVMLYLAQRHDDIKTEMRRILEPQLAQAQPERQSMFNQWLRNYREDAIKANLETLRKEPVGVAERKELIRNNEAIEAAGEAPRRAGPRRLQAQAVALQGILARAAMEAPTQDLDKLASLYGPLHLDRLEEADAVAEYRSFARLLDMCGGEAWIDRAMDGHRYLEEQAAAGQDRERVLEHLLESLALGRDPRMTPVDPPASADAPQAIERDERGLRIGGLRIPVRQDPQV